jgi:hypothetical protein
MRKLSQHLTIFIAILVINHLKPNGNYTYHLRLQSVTVQFVFMCLVWFSHSVQTAIISLNNIN